MEANREAAGPAMAGEVTRMVERARRRMRAATTLVGACHWAVTALGLWLAFFLADNVLALPAGLRLPLALAGGALLLWVLAFRVLVPGFRRLRPEQVALFLEERYGIRENLLINAYQFEGRQFGEAEAEFAGSTISRCEAALEKLDLGQLWEMRRAWPWLAGALGVLLAWLVYAWLLPGFLVNAGQRFAMPLAEIPPPGAPVIRVTPSGEVAIAEGDSVEVKAEIIDRRPISVGQEAPPMIVWIENAETVPTVRGDGEEAAMASVAGGGGGWSHTFAGVRRSFAFRVFGAGTHSAPVSVRVHPLPKITASLFRVTPPEYTGMEATVSAGPPGTLSALIGSRVEIELAVGPRPGAVRWRDPSGVADMAFENGKWRATRVVAGAAPYEIEARVAGLGRDVVIARSQMQVAPDAPPEVEFGSADRNRFAFPGTTVALRVNARDDFGLRRVWITARPAEDDASARASVKSWSFLGPPGRKGEVQERAGLAIDPARFRVGESYLVEAWAADFNPKGKPVSSRPILIRIRSPMDSDLERGDPLVRPFERLRQAVAAQERAMGLAGNLRGHLEEAVAKQDLHEHRRAIGEEGIGADGDVERVRCRWHAGLQGPVANHDGAEVALVGQRLEGVVLDRDVRTALHPQAAVLLAESGEGVAFDHRARRAGAFHADQMGIRIIAEGLRHHEMVVGDPGRLGQVGATGDVQAEPAEGPVFLDPEHALRRRIGSIGVRLERHVHRAGRSLVAQVQAHAVLHADCVLGCRCGEDVARRGLHHVAVHGHELAGAARLAGWHRAVGARIHVDADAHARCTADGLDVVVDQLQAAHRAGGDDAFLGARLRHFDVQVFDAHVLHIAHPDHAAGAAGDIGAGSLEHRGIGRLVVEGAVGDLARPGRRRIRLGERAVVADQAQALGLDQDAVAGEGVVARRHMHGVIRRGHVDRALDRARRSLAAETAATGGRGIPVGSQRRAGAGQNRAPHCEAQHAREPGPEQ